MSAAADKWAGYPEARQTGGDKWAAYPVAELPEFINLIPTPYELASGLPSFLGGGRRAPANKLDVTARQADTLKNVMAIAQDEGQMIDVIRGTLPEARFSRNERGEIVVDVQGKRGVLNRGGFSAQDVVTGATTATAAGIAATPAGQIASLPARALAVGAGVGGASAAQDVGAHLMGAEKVVDLPRVGTAAATGLAGQYALDKFIAPAIAATYRWITGSGARGLYDRVSRRLTQAGADLLRRAGARAEDISDDLARSFAQQAANAAHPGEALRMAQAQTLPVPVQPTRGQVTLRPGDQMFEDMALKNAYGQAASDIMRGTGQRQQEALRANVPAIQARVAGGGPTIEPGTGATMAQQALVAQRATEKAAADAAFTAARSTSAGVPRQLAQEGLHNVRAAVAADHSLAGLPRTTGLLSELDDVANQSGDDVAIMTRSLFDWRKRASSAARGAAQTEEGVALRKAIGGFDDWLNGVVDRGLMQGDEASVAAWQQAIGQYREFAGRFKGGDLIEALTSRSARSGAVRLDVAPEDAANYIFGSSNTGWITKADLTRDLRQVRDLLGRESQAWNALRQEAFLRFARAGEGAFEGGQRMFSGVNFSKAWNNALARNPELMATLFTDGERRLVSQFATVAARVTNAVRGGANFSNTASAMANIAQQVGGRLGTRVAAFLAGLPLAGPVMQGTRAAQALSAAGGRVTPVRPPTGGGAALLGLASGMTGERP